MAVWPSPISVSRLMISSTVTPWAFAWLSCILIVAFDSSIFIVLVSFCLNALMYVLKVSTGVATRASPHANANTTLKNSNILAK
jgi:hypothetical protein